MRYGTLTSLLLTSLFTVAACRTRPWDPLWPDDKQDLAAVPDLSLADLSEPPDLSLADLFVPPDFRDPPDLLIPFVCRQIYVVDAVTKEFTGFDPLTGMFDPGHVLNCPGTNSSPQTMSVGRDERAWVFFSDHKMFYVDIRTGACSPSAFDGTQIQTNSHFGSAFSADQPGGMDESVFLALPDDQQFARVDPGTFKVSRFGAVGSLGSTGAELTGTSTAELWGFFPGDVTSTIARIDKRTGVRDNVISVPLSTSSAGYAFAFWGGDFWIFLYDANNPSTNVYRVNKQTGEFKRILDKTGRHIVGAGVASCAPLGLDQ